MAKFLVEARYTAQGKQGLRKDGGSGRRDATAHALTAIGGRLEAMYFAFGERDVIIIADIPDNVSAAAVAIAAASTGHLETKMTPLLTVEEIDQALSKQTEYRPPGQKG
jgi:uncharacterized protein with GYD domain